MENKILTELPRRNNKNKTVIWKKMIGKEIEILYNNQIFKLLIESYDGKNVYVSYKEKKNVKINSSRFLTCSIGNITGFKTNDYKYDIDEIVKVKTGEVKVIKHIRISVKNGYSVKGYIVKCLNDSYEYEVVESNLLSKTGCGVCCNQTVVKGINDISTTHPDKIKYFANIEDAYSHSYGSVDYIDAICPLCGEVRHNFQIKVLIKNNYICNKCGNAVPYTERFMYSFLQLLVGNDNFEKEYTPKWDGLGMKRYDFYIPSFNIIIETHGRQHYDDKCFEKLSKKTLNQEQENDNLKKELALKNDIKQEHYIVIDCRESNMEWIRESILKSNLNHIFDLNEIDWEEVNKNSMKSRTKDVCDLWNKGLTIKELKLFFKLSSEPILKDLKIGTELGWCNYNAEESKFRANELRKDKKNIIVGINIKNYSSIVFDIKEYDKYGFKKEGIYNALSKRTMCHKDYVFVAKKEYDEKIKDNERYFINNLIYDEHIEIIYSLRENESLSFERISQYLKEVYNKDIKYYNINSIYKKYKKDVMCS